MLTGDDQKKIKDSWGDEITVTFKIPKCDIELLNPMLDDQNLDYTITDGKHMKRIRNTG